MKIQSTPTTGQPFAALAAKHGGKSASTDQASSDTFQQQPGASDTAEMANWAKARGAQQGHQKAALASPSELQDMADQYHAKAEGYGLGLIVGVPFVSSFMGVMTTTLTHSLGLGVAAGLIFPVGMLAAYVHCSDKADAFEKMAKPSAN